MLKSLAAVTLVFSSMAYAATAPPVLRKSPELVIHILDKPDQLLTSYRGKVIALLLVHTTCPHCQHDSQIFNQLYTEFGARGFEPVAVAWNPEAKDPQSGYTLKNFISSNHVSYPAGYSGREEVCDYLGMSPTERATVPQIVWIDRKGYIRSQTPPLGEEKMLQEPYWRDMIQGLLAEPSGGAKKPVHRTSVSK